MVVVKKNPLRYLEAEPLAYAVEWEELDEAPAPRNPAALAPEDRVALGLSPFPAPGGAEPDDATQGAENELHRVME